MEEITARDDQAFEVWLSKKGQVSGLHFLWACHGLRSLVDEKESLQKSAKLVESVYREWIVSGHLELSNEVLRSTIAMLLPHCRPSLTNLESHFAVLRHIEGYVHLHLQSVLLPQFKQQNGGGGNSRRGKKKTKKRQQTNANVKDIKSNNSVVINAEDGLTPSSQRPPPPLLMQPEEFVNQLVSRLEALVLVPPSTLSTIALPLSSSGGNRTLGEG